MSESKHRPSRWKKLGHTIQAKTAVFDVQSVRYRHTARGTEKNFVVVRAPDWVNVLALTRDGRLVLVRQFRFGTDGFSLEIPGGVMEPGEDPVVAGVRELREETGYVGRNARLLGRVHPNPAIQSNWFHVVLVEDAERTAELEWDETEELEVTTLPVEEVLAQARNGGITHSLVLNALFLLEPRWRAHRGEGPKTRDQGPV